MNGEQLTKELQNGNYDDRLLKIYIEPEQLPYQRERYCKAIKEYETIFGHTNQTLEIYSAPGRTEIGGNHTDHQHGRVLTSAVNIDMIAVVEKTALPQIRILSEGYPLLTVNCMEDSYQREEEETTLSLVKGILHAFKENGFTVGGFQAYVTSDVPTGSGLSSSAAFEVLIGSILSGLYNEHRLSPIQNACFGQYAESSYFGKPCGLMDQMACSFGGLMQIDFKDLKNPLIVPVEASLLNEEYQLCIVDVKSSHHELTEEYASIPREMGLIASHYGKHFLREVDKSVFYADIPILRKLYGDRSVLRAYHFFNENQRVEEQTDALNQKDISRFLQLIHQSGDSSYKYLQNIYSNLTPQSQGLSLALAVSEKFLLKAGGACRVHGGGFAGTIQSFVKTEKAIDYQLLMENIFGQDICHFLKLRPYGAIKAL